MRASTRAFRVLFALASSVLTGCMQLGEDALDDQDPKAPGEVLGFFSVDGELTGDTCGAESLAAPREWSFEVKLSRDGSALYWLNGREAIVGQIDSRGAFSFSTHLELPLTPPRGAYKGCTILRADAAQGSLSSPPSSLRAELTYSYAQKSGSDCSELVTGTDGMPEALPCQLQYTLGGARLKEQ